MVPVLVRKGKEADEEASTGDEGSTVLCPPKANESRAITRRSVPEVRQPNHGGSAKPEPVSRAILDDKTRAKLEQEDFNGLVDDLCLF